MNKQRIVPGICKYSKIFAIIINRYTGTNGQTFATPKPKL